MEYDDAFAQLQKKYRARLKEIEKDIDRLLHDAGAGRMGPAMLLTAHEIAHFMAGSGMIYGFPLISARGQEADRLFSDFLRENRPDDYSWPVEDQQSCVNALQNLRSVLNISS